MTATEATPRQHLSVWRYWWGLIKAHPRVYGATTFLRITIFGVMFQITGLLQREFFNALTGDALLSWQPWVWAVLFVVAALFRGGMIMTDMYFYFRWTFSSGAVMRKNMFEHILNRPGARALPGSTGEAISRFRGDVDEVGDFTAWFLFILGQGLFAIFAVIIMVGINPKITIFVFLPLVVIVVIANSTMSRVQKYREDIRGATGHVTGFIGEMFDAAQAIKAATAEENTLKRFHRLNEDRRRTAHKDKLFT
jgi:ATP-binding cassette subfamily B protein